ncbi:MAG: bifunctional folylpolyglutamate synthase/dihydrofolate synthase [Bacteroidales bacterium]|nr:bifunctional folylpolyglutamate synthase/dihydrofolate synthase [Bacteroidales bacterium]
MNYKETTDWLFSHLPMYQRVGKAAYKADLEITLKLDKLMGHPHRKFRSIHVAGTNGKGSVCHMIASVLQQAGYQTGLYTSPHLKDFRERIRINGQPVSQKEVVSFVTKYQSVFEELQPSFFEMTVAMAFELFVQNEVEVAVIETGMGGRLDSTNIIDPEISVITNIGFDHTEFLGTSLGKIAGEKAGIIKDGVPVVVGEKNRHTRKVFEAIAREHQAPLYFANDYFQIPASIVIPESRQYFQVNRGGRIVFPELWSDQLSITQRKNLPVVLEVLDLMRIQGWSVQDDDLYNGLARVKENTGFKGRWEVVSRNPMVVFDTGHNIHGIRQVLLQIRQTRFKQLHFVYGTVADKKIDDILRILPKKAKYYFTQAAIPRSLDVKLLAAKAAFYGLKGSIHETVAEAVVAAKKAAEPDDLVLIGGSTYVVGEGM